VDAVAGRPITINATGTVAAWPGEIGCLSPRCLVLPWSRVRPGWWRTLWRSRTVRLGGLFGRRWRGGAVLWD